MGYKLKKLAEAAGRAALRQLSSKGWKLRVWENIGWYWSLENAPLSLTDFGTHGTANQSYSCMVSGEHDTSGSGDTMWTGNNTRSKTPQEAVTKAVAEFRQAREYETHRMDLIEIAIQKIAT